MTLLGCEHGAVFCRPLTPAHILFKQEAINIFLFFTPSVATLLSHLNTARLQTCCAAIASEKAPSTKWSHCISSSDLPTPKRSEAAFVQGAMTASNLLAPLVWFCPCLSDLFYSFPNFKLRYFLSLFSAMKTTVPSPSASLPLLSLLFLTSGG